MDRNLRVDLRRRSDFDLPWGPGGGNSNSRVPIRGSPGGAPGLPRSEKRYPVDEFCGGGRLSVAPHTARVGPHSDVGSNRGPASGGKGDPWGAQLGGFPLRGPRGSPVGGTVPGELHYVPRGSPRGPRGSPKLGPLGSPVGGNML